MSRKYDIAKRIMSGNKKPTVKIDEEHEYKINNSKSAVLMLEALIEEKEEKVEVVDDIITLALGKEAQQYIESLELPMHLYEDIIKVIMAAFADKSLEELEAEEDEKK